MDFPRKPNGTIGAHSIRCVTRVYGEDSAGPDGAVARGWGTLSLGYAVKKQVLWDVPNMGMGVV